MQLLDVTELVLNGNPVYVQNGSDHYLYSPQVGKIGISHTSLMGDFRTVLFQADLGFVYMYRQRHHFYGNGNFYLFNITCNVLNPFLSGTKNGYFDGACNIAFVPAQRR